MPLVAGLPGSAGINIFTTIDSRVNRISSCLQLTPARRSLIFDRPHRRTRPCPYSYTRLSPRYRPRSRLQGDLLSYSGNYHLGIGFEHCASVPVGLKVVRTENGFWVEFPARTAGGWALGSGTAAARPKGCICRSDQEDFRRVSRSTRDLLVGGLRSKAAAQPMPHARSLCYRRATSRREAMADLA